MTAVHSFLHCKLRVATYVQPLLQKCMHCIKGTKRFAHINKYAPRNSLKMGKHVTHH